jgi:hypothetical protein
MTDYGEQTLNLVQRIRPLLAGRDPSVQGAALAELTATWVHGHFILGDATQTQELRVKLLEEQNKLIRRLLEIDGR